MIQVEDGVRFREVDEAVLFSFDDSSFPFQDGLSLELVAGHKYPGNPVVKRGKPGEPDCRCVRESGGAVVRVGGRYWMWYLGRGDQDDDLPALYPSYFPGWLQSRVCYAVSQDGFHWEKPELGLVEYNGNTQNNLIQFPRRDLLAMFVLHDPEDRERPFKMVFQCTEYGSRLAVAYSRDGLHWSESPDNPVGGRLIEPGGLVKFHGCYYVNGQIGGPRKMHTFASYDFEHWTDASAVSFRRDDILPRSLASPPLEQNHQGASLWNRGNVIVGFYGQWHGHKNNDRRFVDMDLGLLVSNDAIHFREPIPDFKMIPGSEEIDGAGPALMQMQGFENVADQTLVWYIAWREGDVRVATWPRDRLGHYALSHIAPGQTPGKNAHLLSCPLHLDRPGGRMFINADGLSEHCCLRVEICDLSFRRLPGYSAEDCILLTESGLRQPVTWRNRTTLEKFDRPIRIRVSFEGLRPEDARVYALYVSQGET